MTNQEKIQEALKPSNRSEFISLSLAKSFRNRCLKTLYIIHGDNGKFWVMKPKFTERLVKNGFEYTYNF